MATYKEIFGKQIKVLSTDPANEAEGQIWYNTTSDTFKTVLNSAAWSSGSQMVTSRNGVTGTTSSATATWGAGGYDPAGPPYNYALTEEYNGSGFSTSGALNTGGRTGAGFGTQTAGVLAGRNLTSPAVSTAVEHYDGATWTTVTGLPAATRDLGAAGTQTSGVVFGGALDSDVLTAVTLEYDGSSWTSSNALNTGRYGLGGVGTQTAAIAFGGNAPYPTNTVLTEQYNGSSWTSTGAMNTARRLLSGAGISTAALAYGGNSGSPITATEEFDTSSWTTSAATLSTGRAEAAGGGTATNAIMYGGSPNPTPLEEYNKGTTVITAAAWSANPALSYSVDGNLAGSGSLTSAVAAGGYNAPAGPGLVSYVASAATWNGTAWSNITDMPARRTSCSAVGATAPAFYIYGGINQPGPSGPSTSYLTTTDTWNGSSWGSGPALAEAQSNAGSAGTPSAIVLMGGAGPPGSSGDNIQQYNGSSWANSPVDYPTVIQSLAGVGTETAALFFGGTTPAEPAGTKATNEWNGSAISTGGDMNLALQLTSGSGTQTAALSYGGRLAGAKNAQGMIYDGTAWATSPNLANARDAIALGPMGSTTSALATSGSGPAQSLVEEFTGETTATNYRTITTS